MQAFALTKIQPPRARAGLIERPALEAAMVDAAMTRKLVVVAAPAGFGKTAALARLIERLRGRARVAWVAADVGDDPLGLLACLIAALEPFDLPWRTDPDALVAAAAGNRSQRQAVAVQLLNALAACDVERGLVVVDDAHRIADAAVFEFLDVVLERLPVQWGFVVAGRSAPPLASLARLRAGDEVAEFGQRALRFDAAEVAALVTSSPVARVAGGQAHRALLERTQGWAVGLRLALNGIAADEARGDRDAASAGGPAVDRDVFDYLLSEVLAGLPEALRLFLLRTSLLPELTAARAAAVSGDADAARWIEQIERRGLFASVLQGHEPTLRLHDLFREFLRDRLRRERADELPDLCRRAAAGESDTLRRIGYLLQAADWAGAEQTLAEAGASIITALGSAPLLRLIEQFPPAQRERSPMLALMQALAAWARWDWKAMQRAAAAASLGFEAAGDPLRAWRASLYEAIALGRDGLGAEALRRVDAEPAGAPTADRALGAIVRVYVAVDEGRLDEVAAEYERALDLVEQVRSPMLWYQCVPRGLQSGLPGMTPLLARFADGALAAAGDAPTPLRAIALVCSGWHALWCGRFDAAAALAAQAETDARWLGWPANVRLAYGAFAALLETLRGRVDAAADALAELMALFDAPGGGYDRTTGLYAYHLKFAERLADVAGDGIDASRLRAAADGAPAASTSTTNVAAPRSLGSLIDAQARATQGRTALREGRVADAAAAWQEALAAERALHVYGEAVEIRVRLAALEARGGQPDRAAERLLPVFDAARREGGPGGALAAGAAIWSELCGLAWQGRLGADDVATMARWRDLLAQAREDATSTATTSSSSGRDEAHAAPAADEPGASAIGVRAAEDRGRRGREPAPLRDVLSPREWEVLRLIAAGESNKVIARVYELSPHTVKRHVANILDKLDLASRGQAAAWFREHADAPRG